jgi:microcystin-dependent protein
MSNPFLAELRIASFSFAPTGWALANGQLLPINQNQALFALLGTTYGGDGRVNFALPNLQGRLPMHFGNGFTQGQKGGAENAVFHTAPVPVASSGIGTPQSVPTQPTATGTTLSPFIVLNFIVALQGIFPSQN